MDIHYKRNENWLQVWRSDGKDGLSWDLLQEIKNKVFGEESSAVEIYPPKSQVVNLKNVRHLWLLPNVKLPNLRDYLNLPPS